MATLLEYLHWRGDLSFDVSPFCVADDLVMTRIAYMPFDGILSFDEPMSLAQACTALLLHERLHTRLTRQEDITFLQLLKESTRFCDLQVSRYVSHLDREQEKQFAAITIDITDRLRYLAFRGTDNTLTGWKEDFNMSFMYCVPSQYEAVAYLDGAYVPGKRYRMSGHSKGGNLAVFAAAYTNPVVQECIDAVYSFDGPGFHEAILASDGYRGIRDRVMSIVPQTSVIGMLLDHGAHNTIIRSTQRGFMQHDMYSWQMRREGFEYLEDITGTSRFIDSTLRQWLTAQKPEQREAFVDSLFYVLENLQAEGNEEGLVNRYRTVKRAVAILRQMDPELRQPLSRALKLLFTVVQNNARAALSKRKKQGLVEKE